MIKFYEVAPEYRESPIDEYYFGEGCIYEEIAIVENTHYYRPHKTALFQLACDVFDSIRNYDYTVDEVEKCYDIVDKTALNEAYNVTDMREAMCLLMKALSGREWKNREIRGACQGEWQVVYYPADLWDEEGLKWFETAYWNMGSEWTAVENEDDYGRYYTCEWDDKKMKSDLADQLGVSVEECEFYKFDDWERKPKYKRI